MSVAEEDGSAGRRAKAEGPKYVTEEDGSAGRRAQGCRTARSFSKVGCPSEAELRGDIVRFCKLLHEKGFLAANDGNVSARLEDGRILVTPTGVAKAFLDPDELAIVDEGGEWLEGRLPPTGELPMHLEILKRRPDIGVVVHAHPPTCIALSLTRNPRLNGVLPEVILSLGTIEIVPYARPQTEALARALAGRIDHSDAMILERHGTVTVGRSVAEAYFRTERLEHAAQVLWLAHALGRPSPLPDPEVRALLAAHADARTPRAR